MEKTIKNKLVKKKEGKKHQKSKQSNLKYEQRSCFNTSAKKMYRLSTDT